MASSGQKAHSVLKLFTGFARAVLIVLAHNIASETRNIKAPPIGNIHQLKDVRYAKFCSHAFAAYHAMGMAIIKATTTRLKKSFDSNETSWVTDAPTTLRMPISFLRRLVIYMTRPSRPRQLM